MSCVGVKSEAVDATSIPAPGHSPRRLPKRLLALRADVGLVARVRDGDEAAFEVLYERHASGILSVCRHMLATQDEAEDAAQQTFASAYQDLLRDQREIRVKPWLYTIARNRCLSMLRARREEDTEAELSVAGLGEQVQRRAELRELLRDLHDLPPDQRAALVLSELGDLSHADVAEVLGCEAANVKGLVFRARSGLIERRDARAAPCEQIREELASARRGGLRKGRLRHHLRACPGCTAYLADVRRQRQMLGLALPVVPSLALKQSVLAAAGLGGGGAAGGGLALGGIASGATLAKAAAVVVIAGSGATAGKTVLDSQERPPTDVPAAAPARGERPSAAKDDAPLGRPANPGERSASDRGALGRERGRSRGRGRKAGHAKPVAPKPERRGRRQATGLERRALTPAGPKLPAPARVTPSKPPRPVRRPTPDPRANAPALAPGQTVRGKQPKD
jgi:RNA polymerase sigma factor (sigma-70 family)